MGGVSLMVEPTSISQDIYRIIQKHGKALSEEPIRNQPHHLEVLESAIKIAKEDWVQKNG